MNGYVAPYSDIFIKYLLGSEHNKGLLLSFVNSVMEDAGFPRVTHLEIRNPFNIKSFQADKESILDVKAFDENKRQFNIEIQASGNEIFRHRSLYYWAKLYTEQLKEGEIYGKLKPTININIINFELFPQLDGFHSKFLITERDRPQYVLTDHLMLHFLELPSWQKNRWYSKLDRWMAFLKYEGSKEEIMEILIKDDDDMAKAHEQYRHFTADDILREQYEAHEKWRKDYNTLIHSAQQEAEKREKQAKLDAARRMKEDGLAYELIAKYTGLSEEEIEKL
jgi:predicted transposase/invertase (TIGR01784 family)